MLFDAMKLYSSQVYELPPISKVPENGQVIVKAGKAISAKHPIVIVSMDSYIDDGVAIKLKNPYASYTFMKLDGSWSVI